MCLFDVGLNDIHDEVALLEEGVHQVGVIVELDQKDVSCEALLLQTEHLVDESGPHILLRLFDQLHQLREAELLAQRLAVGQLVAVHRVEKEIAKVIPKEQEFRKIFRSCIDQHQLGSEHQCDRLEERAAHGDF